ncbi:helix-turn-helix transcriptional regulator [Frankia sp. R82]|uniref:helix-turn-helix domain-containing protein n=1 Tax=Frankia sp. R82 TaxID=2950553 RepID=UPI002043F194|nr:helix-turn-helix transcriptional regulator [Frankia sp. R82]MCM3886040.1 helix-turn-helix domain-containing protein [Frankia sp. R82]
MKETPRAGAIVVTADAAAQSLFAQEFARLLDATGLTQERLAPRVGRSAPTLSRYRTGRSLPEESLLLAVCEQAKVTDRGERDRLLGLLRQARATRTMPAADSATASDQEAGDPNRSDPNDVAGATPRGGRSKLRTWRRGGSVAAVVVVVLMAAGCLAVRGYGTGRPAGSSSTPPPLRTRVAASPSPEGPCRRYVVTAEDVALRDEHGHPVGDEVSKKLLRGTHLMVTKSVESNAKRYWFAVAEDGRSGFVSLDPRYLALAC